MAKSKTQEQLKMSAEKWNALLGEIEEFLGHLGEAYELKLDVERTAVPNPLTFRIVLKGLVDESGDPHELQWRVNFIAHAKAIKIEEDFIGKMFEWGETPETTSLYRFVGMKKRIKKYPFIVFDMRKKKYFCLSKEAFMKAYELFKEKEKDVRIRETKKPDDSLEE